LCESCALSEKLHALEELLETRVGVQGDEPGIDFEKDHEVGVLAFGFGETAESGLVVSQRDLHEAGLFVRGKTKLNLFGNSVGPLNG